MTEMANWEVAVQRLRNDPVQREAVLQNFYDDPVSAAAERYYASSEWSAVRALLPKDGGRALDVGAGRGISSYALAREGWQVTALEPDPSSIVGSGAIQSLVTETGVNIEICTTWGEALPFPDASFNLVYCRAVLHHARDLGQLCAQMHRVLKPGGLLVATREHVVGDKRELTAFLLSHPLHRHYGGENAYRLQEYRNAITGAGFRIEREFAPYESDINTFPQTRAELIEGLRNRWGRFPSWTPWLLLLRLRGRLRPVPGRLYSFLAYRQ